METGTLIKWNNNQIAGICRGLFLKQENDSQSWVIMTSIGEKITKNKVLVDTAKLEVDDEQL